MPQQNVRSTIIPDELICISDDEDMTITKLGELIAKHKNLITNRYKVLKDAYMNMYPNLTWQDKEDWKPDNRVTVNFAKYLVDTFNGYFIGIPIKVQSDDKKVTDYLDMFDSYNDIEDNNAELSRICSIYGKGYELYANDESGDISIVYLDPTEGFMVYDNTYEQHPKYFVTYYYDSKKIMHGEVLTPTEAWPFTDDGGLHYLEDEFRPHNFGDIPATEFLENESRIAVFESVYSLIVGYNKALSEKLNDVDAFADAYLKILGPKLTDDMLRDMRDHRVISFEGDMSENPVEVGFLEKPNADGTQENSLNRMERLIYQVSMIANINDENFGNSSGIAMAYKLQSMSNLAKTKERKFTSGLNRRYRIIFSNPVNSMTESDWIGLTYHYTRNLPQNILEETQIAQNLSGIVSQPTQLSVLSIVDDPQKEIERIEEEQQDKNDAIVNQYFGNNPVYPNQGQEVGKDEQEQ